MSSTLEREQIPARRKHRGNVLYPASTPYWFVAPFLVIFLVFLVFPIIYSLVISFSQWSAGSLHFRGLFQYSKLFSDGQFWHSLANTFIILIIQVPVMIGLAALFATLLNSPRLRWKPLFQLGFFLPILIDSVAYSMTWSFILDNHGLINHILNTFGIPSVNWLGNAVAAKVSIMLAITWHWTGYNVVILLGGMQSMPSEVYEAARVDGASAIRQWFSMTLPLLRPILLFEAVLSTIGTMQLFTEPFILTGGGPANSTLTPVLYLYKMGFQTFDFGYAAAIAYVLAIIIAVFSVIQMRLTRGGEI